MELDHIFLMIEENGPQIEQLKEFGLVETYRRDHVGQGTSNICYCFDNMFLELLWVTDRAEASSVRAQRLGLLERADWRSNGACPIGLAWRGDTSTIETWDYCPEYLPTNMSIPMAVDSDDASQPLMFQSPGTSAPIDWPEEKRGALQYQVGLTRVTKAKILHPAMLCRSEAFRYLENNTIVESILNDADEWNIELEIASSGLEQSRILKL